MLGPESSVFLIFPFQKDFYNMDRENKMTV